MHRYFITGTDTDVGKTRVSAALALALRNAALSPTVVKLVQTGLTQGAAGDAERAGRLAAVPFVELRRFAKAADPWSAALAERTPLSCSALAGELASMAGALIVEGSGGVMVPLNAHEQLGDVAAEAGLETIVVVGLRIGCLNHALLTLEHCERRRVAVAGVVLVERWSATTPAYRDDVRRVLQGKSQIFGILPFAPNEAGSVEAGAKLFEPLVNRRR
jgi:dethiobiotin synthetase